MHACMHASNALNMFLSHALQGYTMHLCKLLLVPRFQPLCLPGDKVAMHLAYEPRCSDTLGLLCLTIQGLWYGIA